MTLMRMPPFTWTMVATCVMTVFGFPALIVALGLLWAQRHLGGVLVGRGGRGRLPGAVLVLRAPGRVRDVLPVRGDGRGDHRDLLFAAVLRLFRVHRRAARLLRPVDDRVGASHVHVRGALEQVLRADLDRARRPRRDRVLRLPRDDLAREAALHHGLPVRARLPRAVPRRRTDRHHPRLAAAGLRAEHVLLRGGPLPLHDLRGQRLRSVRRDLLLVSEGHRRDAARAPRQAELLADGDRREPDVLPDVLSRRRGHGPPRRPLPGLERLAGTEHRLDGRRLRDRGLGARVHRQPRRLAARARPAGEDPWGAHTLEWATSSPPPRHNFDALPPIRSYAPLLDLRENRGEGP